MGGYRCHRYLSGSIGHGPYYPRRPGFQVVVTDGQGLPNGLEHTLRVPRPLVAVVRREIVEGIGLWLNRR